MEYISLLISVFFILASLLSIYWGTHIIQLNMKSNINRVFLLLSIALSIWAFGFAMANSSSNIELALFWRRISSVGMISLYSFVLHFFLLLTRQSQDEKLNKIVCLLYIPAILLIYIFTFSSSMAMVQYDLVQTDYGLTNVASNSIWNYFYYVYYVVYMIFSIRIIWKWKKKIKEKVRTRQANIIMGATLASGIIATLTDIFSTTFMSKPLPQMAPLFILMPVGAMYYSARYYGMMNLDKNYHEEMIVTEEDRKKIFNNISMALYLGAILAFASEYLPYMDEENSFKVALLKGLFLISLGLSINIMEDCIIKLVT